MTVDLSKSALLERRYKVDRSLDQAQGDGTLLAVVTFWRGGRAVYGSGLENRQAERPRGFESHPLRQLHRAA